MSVKKIAVVIGSLRKDSLTRKCALELIAQAPATLSMEIVEIGDLVMFNQDLEENGATAPHPWTRFRQRIEAMDGVMFFTPEYNRSVPAALKNALDIGSRPYGANVWAGKPAAVVSVSPGALGGFGANHHLRQSLVFLDMPTMQQPEAYIGNAAELIGVDGAITSERTRLFLQKIATGFAAWVDVNASR